MLLILSASAATLRFHAPFNDMPSGMTLEAPENTIGAQFTDMSGEVLQYARGADGFTPATPSGSIRQGETVATPNGKATISLGNQGSLILDSGAEVALVSLTPDALLFLQKFGPVRYMTDGRQFSVRVSRAAVELTGISNIEREPDGFTLRVSSGSARIGHVDSDNVTHVTEIPKGSRAEFSETALSLKVF